MEHNYKNISFTMEALINIRESAPFDFVYALGLALDSQTVDHLLRTKINVYNKFNTFFDFLNQLDGGNLEKVANVFNTTEFINGYIVNIDLDRTVYNRAIIELGFSDTFLIINAHRLPLLRNITSAMSLLESDKMVRDISNQKYKGEL